jgi:hypothetical protein
MHTDMPQAIKQQELAEFAQNYSLEIDTCLPTETWHELHTHDHTSPAVGTPCP